jgi:DNA-binding NarL/FixJ family response regulator
MASKSTSDSVSPAAATRIFLVDDHPVLRQGLAQLINQQPGLSICGEADDPNAALAAIPKASPDLVILDLRLRGGDGMDLCKQLHHRWPTLAILVISMHDEKLYAERALRAGAMGYIMKEQPSEQVIAAIRKILAGDVYLSDAMSAKLLQSLSGTRAGAPTSPLERLSDRELEIFRRVGRGESVQTIAESLYLSPKTVEAHKEHIKQKLKLKTNNELLQYAIETRVTEAI